MRNEPNEVSPLQQIMNADKATKVRMQLAILLHAQKYQHIDDSNHRECQVPFCQIGRVIWKHIKICTPEHQCTEPRCKISREILSHWEICSKNQLYCKVCTPLKVAKLKHSKRIEVPNCWTARNLIRHYKMCKLADCKRCKISKYIKRRICGPGIVPNQRVCHSGLLKHSCRCYDKTCQNPMCIKMKRVLVHTNLCRMKRPEPMLCREIILFCLNHSVTCTAHDCILLSATPTITV